MHKLVTVFLALLLSVYSKDISPIATIKASGLVTDFVEDGGYLYVATDAGSIDIIDLTKQKIVDKITIEPLKNARGETISARIHSVDRLYGKTLFVSSAENAYRKVWIDDGEHLKKIIDDKKKIMPKRAFFAPDGKIVFGTFGSDIILYDNMENYRLYENHISESTMGGMVLSRDRKKMIIADESGTVRLIDVNSSKVEKTLSSEHVDNIYRVAYSRGIIVTAGQDRRVGVYLPNKKAYHVKSDFLVYCVGLSPSGKVGVYSSDTENNLQLFNTEDGTKTDRLVGHFATPNKIIFINENALVSTGDEESIFFWIINK